MQRELEIWSTFTTNRCTTLNTTQVHILKQYSSFIGKPYLIIHSSHTKLDKGIRNHINKFLIIASKLREVGQPLRDSLLLNKIVHALPESYAQFRARWGETSAVDRTIDNLTLRLIAEEQIIASYQQNVSKDNTAFHASGKIYIYICNT